MERSGLIDNDKSSGRNSYEKTCYIAVAICLSYEIATSMKKKHLKSHVVRETDASFESVAKRNTPSKDRCTVRARRV